MRWIPVLIVPMAAVLVLAVPAWAEVPLDAGTEQVISDGIRILYDPEGLLGGAMDAV